MNKLLITLLILPALTLCCLFTACETGGDDPGDPTPIDGEAVLRVTNVSDYDSTVYFDGDYIGNVDDDSSRNWNVPTGVHRITIDNADLDNTDGASDDYNFVAGRTTVVVIDWDWDDGDLF